MLDLFFLIKLECEKLKLLEKCLEMHLRFHKTNFSYFDSSPPQVLILSISPNNNEKIHSQ